MVRRFALLTVPLTAGLGLLGPSIVAGAATPKIRDGFYTTGSIPSADAELWVGSRGTKITYLQVVCDPSPRYSRIPPTFDDEQLAVHPPTLKISHGKFSYHGQAKITAPTDGSPKVAETTMKIAGTWVDGPQLQRFSHDGRIYHAKRAWVGTMSSPACSSTTSGRFTLFGPAPY